MVKQAPIWTGDLQSHTLSTTPQGNPKEVRKLSWSIWSWTALAFVRRFDCEVDPSHQCNNSLFSHVFQPCFISSLNHGGSNQQGSPSDELPMQFVGAFNAHSLIGSYTRCTYYRASIRKLLGMEVIKAIFTKWWSGIRINVVMKKEITF